MNPLEELRRAEERKLQKRAANRKSASVSRARKKSLIEEKTLDNARMRANAQILTLLSDLIVTVCRSRCSSGGFCKAYYKLHSASFRVQVS